VCHPKSILYIYIYIMLCPLHSLIKHLKVEKYYQLKKKHYFSINYLKQIYFRCRQKSQLLLLPLARRHLSLSLSHALAETQKTAKLQTHSPFLPKITNTTPHHTPGFHLLALVCFGINTNSRILYKTIKLNLKKKERKIA
jgi:hypothetical protein